ncbi:MAG: SpoIID/LytB domain-containing protein [Candidatus Dojkabacteria bacterium]
MKKKILNSLLMLPLIVVLFAGLFSPVAVVARTAEEIEQEINENQKQLDDLNSQLKDAESTLKNSESAKLSSLSEIEAVRMELDKITAELKVNKLMQKKLRQEIELKELEEEETRREQDDQIASAYILWKTDDVAVKIFGSGDIVKNVVYQEFLSERSNERILGLSTDLVELVSTNDQYSKNIELLAKDSTTLDQKKKSLESQITQLENTIAQTNEDVKGIRALVTTTQQATDLLKSELESQLSDDSESGTNELISGELYFTATAIRPEPPASSAYDAFGHGLGMSQWGAYGGANKGMSAEDIIRHYYKNTVVEERPGRNIRVAGHGTMTVEKYAAGIGEVPSKACGTQADIEAWTEFADNEGWDPQDPKRKKYVIDNPNSVWDCWPEEAIKAQLIAARSYGVTSAQPICTDARCQVYIGQDAKAWAAFETKDQYAVSKGYTHRNQVIRAFYSAYNHNGWGTADHKTIWGSNDGNSRSWSYLRAVKDSNFTYNYIFYRTPSTRTNSYSINQLDSMLKWCARQGNCSTWSWMKSNVTNKLGKLTALRLEHDPSGRVQRVVLVGTNGNATTSGIYFRSVFNKWIESVRPSGQLDKIVGITFSVHTAN